jgi:hypothetical protein
LNNTPLEQIQSGVTYFCHLISYVALFSFPVLIIFLAIYAVGPIEIEILNDISVALLYAWLVLISLYLGRIPRLAWNNKDSNYNTMIVYYSLFPIFSTLILIISLVKIFSSYGAIEIRSDWLDLITYYLTVFLITEIVLDFISLIKHANDSQSRFDQKSKIFEFYQDKFFTYNRTCWFIFLSGIASIYIGLTRPEYLAITGVVLSIEHIIAAITD